nr:histone-lysine N-methyltransferase, H3 lysine-9 specific SUVH4 [Tanacetum cinerariifolium]GEW89760.1 histone-lysine N-methyltransferase, H3 lysine-9 specific SUVH4 [Tanacetum cinerariifolium]
MVKNNETRRSSYGERLSEGVVDVERGEVYADGKGAGLGANESSYTRVKDTIMSFYKYYLQFVQMQKSNLSLVPKNRIGSIPGVDVGHQFLSRCEMVTVGFHNHWLNGIDYIGVNQHKDYLDYELPITVAIVMSGMYEDDVDNCADVVYTAQGGNHLLGNK